MRLGLGLRLRPQGGLLNPIASLFSGGAQGAWYDPSDMTTLFQDAAGTTPVTAVEQPVGLMLDKSKGLVLGSELVTNGTFDISTTGWTSNVNVTQSVENNQLKVLAISGTSNFETAQTVSTTAGTWYKISGTITSAIGNSAVRARIRITNAGVNTDIQAVSPGVPVSQTLYILATSTTLTVSVGVASTAAWGSVGDIAYADNISAKQLPGNHAFQTTAASRPVLSARYNLLTKTEQFDDAAWPKENVTIVANNVVAPNGTATAELIYPTTTGSNRRILRPTSLTAGVIYEQSVYVKAAGKQWVFLNGVDASSAVNNCWFDLENGVIGTKGSSVLSAGITAVGNGWYRIFATGAAAANTFFYLMTVDGNNSLVSTTNGTSGVYIWGASLVQTAQAPTAYQRVNTSTDYDTVGFKPYLLADGVDDGMVTNSIDFTATDKMTVCAGVRKLSDATQEIVGLSNAWTANTGSFGLYLESGVTQYASASRGTASPVANQVASVSSGFAAPITNVIASTHDIAGNLTTLRLNTVAQTSATGNKGTGNYGNYPLYLFRRGGTSLPFNGRFYGMTVVGKTVTAGELASLEAYTNSKTGAY